MKDARLNITFRWTARSGACSPQECKFQSYILNFLWHVILHITYLTQWTPQDYKIHYYILHHHKYTKDPIRSKLHNIHDLQNRANIIKMIHDYILYKLSICLTKITALFDTKTIKIATTFLQKPIVKT